MAIAGFRESLREQKLGWLRAGKWRAMLRLTVWQGNWRLVDTGRSSRTNEAWGADESAHARSVEVGLAVVRRLLTLQGADGSVEAVRRGIMDMGAAYRQIPPRPPRRITWYACSAPKGRCGSLRLPADSPSGFPRQFSRSAEHHHISRPSFAGG